MKYIVKSASYRNSKSIFWLLIRFQQRIIQGLPWKNARNSHSESVFEYVNDLAVFSRIFGIEKVYFWKNNIEIPIERRIEYFKKYNLWFSSSEVDWGTRFKFIEDDKEKWSYKEFEVTKRKYLEALDYCIEREGNRYWFTSIVFTQILKTLWFVDKESPFCSQITTEVLQTLGYLKHYNSIEINPGILDYILHVWPYRSKPKFWLLIVLVWMFLYFTVNKIFF